MKFQGIVLAGQAGNGKSTLAKMLQKELKEEYNKESEITAYAKNLKDCISSAFEIPREHLNCPVAKTHIYKTHKFVLDRRKLDKIIVTFGLEKDKKEIKEKFAGKKFKSIREIMQFVGTDIIRAYTNGLRHVEMLDINHDVVTIIDDARFPQEIIHVKDKGFISIFVDRSVIRAEDSHASEAVAKTLRDMCIYEVDNSGSVGHLREFARYILRMERNKGRL